MTDILICPNCWRTNQRRVEGVDVDPLPEHGTRWVQCPDCATTLLYLDDRGQLDIGIHRTDPDDMARNEYKLFHEAFEGLAFPQQRGAITFITPPTPEEVLAALRQALVALIEPDPMCDDREFGAYCHWCSAPFGRYPEWNKQREPVQHEHVCPWVAGHRALGRRLPDGHEGQGPTCASD